MIPAWAFLASCSSTLAPAQMKDEFFQPLDRRPKPEQRLPETKMQQEQSGNQAEVEALRNENRMLRDSLGRMRNFTAQAKRQEQLKVALESANVIQQDRSGVSLHEKSDSVKAFLTRKSEAEPPSLVGPVNRAYTVQIGAFGRGMLHLALRLQKTAQEQFSNQIVLKYYFPLDGLYRVSVGKFETRNEASLLRKELMEKFPGDYSQCWVNHFAR